MSSTPEEWACAASNKKGEPCQSPFRSTDNPDYCSRHDPGREEYWREVSEKGGYNNKKGRVYCALDGCKRKLENGRTVWCSDEHQQVGIRRRARERKDLEAGRVPAASQTRKPPREFYDDGWDRMEPTADVRKDCAAFFDVDLSTVTRWYAYLRAEQVRQAEEDNWEPPPREFPEQHWELTLAHLAALVADFLWFRNTFLRTGRGRAYWTPEFQLRWIRAVLTALITGGRLVILSPVRHGKTELMIHFSVWLIVRFPNISILWIGGNERIAQKSVSHVLRILGNNKKLVDAFAPGGFRPDAKSGLPWSKTEFTVATRTVEVKGSTMMALGRGGTTASLDADIAIGDDIEDHGATVQPGSRENTRDWWTSDFESRKEEHTALFLIGSRSHPDDLAGHLLENEQYETIVETAHDPICEIPWTEDRYVDHVDCMLFPELRSFRWLMQQRKAAETTGGVSRFNMVYLNQAEGKGLTIFGAAEIAACRDYNYRIGMIPTPIIPDGSDPDTEVGGISLVAGLDPSGSGYQAAFLWAYQIRPELHMWMVDIENHEGGGIAQARSTIEDWHAKYGVSHWVVEENLYQGGIMDDEILMAIRTRLGIIVEPHRTGINKWDTHLGVSTLQPLFAERKIILPYGDEASQEKSELYQRQLVRFSDSPRNRNRTGDKDDVVMASWFPMGAIRRARMEYVAEAGVDYTPSYPGYRGSSWSTAPWGKTRSLSAP